MNAFITNKMAVRDQPQRSDVHDNLETYFERCSSIVRQYADLQVQVTYLLPTSITLLPGSNSITHVRPCKLLLNVLKRILFGWYSSPPLMYWEYIQTVPDICWHRRCALCCATTFLYVRTVRGAVLSTEFVLSFSGISIFAVFSITFFAITLAVVAFLIVEATLGTLYQQPHHNLNPDLEAVPIALCTLCIVFLVAVFTTTFLLSAYSFWRLLSLARSDGRAGAMRWLFETRQHFLPVAQTEEHESDGSTVMIDPLTPEGGAKTNDLDGPENKDKHVY